MGLDFTGIFLIMEFAEFRTVGAESPQTLYLAGRPFTAEQNESGVRRGKLHMTEPFIYLVDFMNCATLNINRIERVGQFGLPDVSNPFVPREVRGIILFLTHAVTAGQQGFVRVDGQPPAPLVVRGNLGDFACFQGIQVRAEHLVAAQVIQYATLRRHHLKSCVDGGYLTHIQGVEVHGKRAAALFRIAHECHFVPGFSKRILMKIKHLVGAVAP
ncbi:MAG: hypothetical protein BWY09_03099 [Candidatus Hydrogenedentes bacterium ADurb.Bin179]|nr:MAG: hypothetical protein BWY09_03099 [Candidatus Hydrogenedentes bacterium ADurb.Bin179]